MNAPNMPTVAQELAYLQYCGKNIIEAQVTISTFHGELEIFIQDFRFTEPRRALRFLQRLVDEQMALAREHDARKEEEKEEEKEAEAAS